MRALIGFASLALIATGHGRPARAETNPFRGDIEKLTEQNADFRHVLFTGANVQVVAMSLRPAEEIGEEVHAVDQCFFVVDGKGESVVGATKSALGEHGALCVPAGTRHNIRNTGDEPLKLYTLYAPPQHPPGTVHHTKADAERAEAAKGKR